MNAVKDKEKLTFLLEGRLDSITAPELTEYIQGEDFQELVLDLSQLSYISSAGLRSLLVCKQKAEESKASMVVKNPCMAVLEVLKMSGFDKILTIEKS